MRSYRLQAVLNNGNIIDLDFLKIPDRLIDIDCFTNGIDRWILNSLLSPHIDLNTINQIKDYQIAIRGKSFCYSVLFQNPYLKEVFSTNSYSRGYRDAYIESSSRVYTEMLKFLFKDLDTGGKQFLTNYSYKNELMDIVKRYLSFYVETNEDLVEKEKLKSEILKTIKNYKTFRSLCIYRNNLDKNKGYFNPMIKNSKVKNLRVSESEFITSQNYHVKKEEPKRSSTTIVSVWYNDSGEEREEFLEEDEIIQMGKNYGN